MDLKTIFFSMQSKFLLKICKKIHFRWLIFDWCYLIFRQLGHR